MKLGSRSLTGALYLRIVLAVAAIGLTMAALSLMVADRALDRESDAQLVTASSVLFALMQDELDETTDHRLPDRPVEIGDDLLSAEDARAFHASADWRMFAVFHHGRSILRSDTAPPAASIPRKAGFQLFTTSGERWRSYGLVVPRYGLLLVVGEQLHVRHLVVREIVERLLLPLLALLPITAVLLHISLRGGLASLRRLSGTLAARTPQDLTRLDPSAWPRDLSVLIISLNHLLDRVDDALTREQGFTDDAAHQLRTPLAAMRIQTQALLAAVPTGEQARCRAVLDSIGRASTLVERMLVLARLEGMTVDRGSIALRDVVASVIADHALIAAHKDVEFELDCDDAAVETDPTILAMALAAVVENAVKHSPHGGRIVVRASAAGGGGTSIRVVDQGNGIPLRDRDHLFDRFVHGSGPESGSGLGLTIARRAMTALGGTIELADESGCGLVVVLTIPC